jgi:putative YphP/YqiW family bacilliredoxin
MWEELEFVGFQSLRSPEEVAEALDSVDDSSTLLVINSVCGCAAGNCRPGVAQALQNKTIPDKLVTVFAGVDTEAVAAARERLAGVQPSSPFIALFKAGKPVAVLERRHIEGASAEEVAQVLVQVFNEECHAKGPSIPPEQFKNRPYDDRCSSSIGLYPGG